MSSEAPANMREWRRLDALHRIVSVMPPHFLRRRVKIIIVVEVAFSIVLVGAALLIRTLTRLSAIEPRFDPNGVVTAQIDLPADRYPTPAACEAFLTN